MAEKSPSRSVEEEDQIAQMSQLSLSPSVEAPKTIIQTGPLFTPGIGDGLIKIINQLDRSSFLKFSRTCKPVHDFCYNTKEIQLDFGRRDDGHLDNFNFRIKVDTSDVSLNVYVLSFLYKKFSDEELENLLKFPFVFTITNIYFSTSNNEKIDSSVFEKLSTFLRRFSRVHLGIIETENVGDWNAFARFIKEFGAEYVYIRDWTTVPSEVLPIFMNKVDQFVYYGQVPGDLILSATSKSLYLYGAAISNETFKELLKGFRAGLVRCWTLGRHWSYVEEDPFLINACSEVMEVISVRQIEAIDMKPDVLYVVPHTDDSLFYMLKSDGSVGEFANRVESMGGGPSRRTLEEENQIAQMSQLSLSSPAEAPKAIIQTGPLFTPGIGEGLIKIVNQLDPVSFLRFTRTCKPIQNFCYNTKGIEVQFGCRDVYKDKFGCHISVYLPSTGDASVLLETRRYNPGFASEGKYFSNEDLENLLKQPFLINVREVYFCPSPRDKVRARDLAQLRTLLRRFPRVRLGNIDPFIVADWNAFAQLIQEFGAKKIHIDSWITPIPVEVLPIFVNKVDDFEYHGRVPDDLILSATSKRLRLPHAAISQDTFKELLKRFRGGFLHRWFLGREINPGEEDLFLVDVCWEVMEVVSVKEIEETNMKPDVLYVVPQDSERQFYMLKYDGSVGKIVVDRLFVDFGSRLP